MSSNKRKSTEQFIIESNIIHNNKYNYSKTQYLNNYTKVIISCKEHGDFLQTPVFHLRGNGCKKCSIKSKTKTTKLFIIQASNTHNNKYDYSKTCYINNHTEVIIKCNKHSEFKQKPTVHLLGSGCQKCANENKSSNINNIYYKCNIIHNCKYTYKKINYKNCYTKLKIICKDHGEFHQTATSHLSGHGCPKCAGVKKYTLKEFVEKANKIHNKYDYSKVIYKNISTKVIIICNKHGEFKQTPNRHLLGDGCVKCSNEIKTLTLEEFILKSNKVHNKKYDYSQSKYTNNYTKIKIKCKKHGVFKQKPSFHMSGMGCNKCKKESQRKCINKFIEQANNIHHHKYDYSLSEYINQYKKIIITCLEHGNFFQRPKDHLNGNGCPKCSKRISKKESQWLDSLNIKKENRQISLPGLPKRWKVDGYDPKTNTVYEFYGDYWHGNPSSFNSNDINPSVNKSFGELYNKTIKRENRIKKEGYKLIVIWEKDLKMKEI